MFTYYDIIDCLLNVGSTFDSSSCSIAKANKMSTHGPEPTAAAGGAGEWRVDVERELAAANAKVARWRGHSIYRVPGCTKELSTDVARAYKPQVVSLGPFHHGANGLLPMEEHKRRAMLCLLKRRKKKATQLVAALEEVAERLEGAYEGLADDEWPAAGGAGASREKFLRMMVLDGCFLLEVMRIAGAAEHDNEADGSSRGQADDAGGDDAQRAEGAVDGDGYRQDDPVFSSHGVLYTVPYVRRDMLVIENQLPLLVLLRLEQVLSDGTKTKVNDESINMMVLRFMFPEKSSPSIAAEDAKELGLHPLDIYRKGLLYNYKGPPRSWKLWSKRSSHHLDRPSSSMRPIIMNKQRSDDDQKAAKICRKDGESSHAIIRSAVELYNAGIRFRRSSSGSLRDVRFRCGKLSLPRVAVDDSTEYQLRNVMAFERLHVGAGSEVTSYVFLMDNLIDTARDVALLTGKGIIENAVGSDKEMARLFNGLSRDVVLDPDGDLNELHREVRAYCGKPCNVWRAHLLHTYFKSPWAFLSLAAAVFIIALTVTQTVYTVLQFYHGDAAAASSLAPAPR